VDIAAPHPRSCAPGVEDLIDRNRSGYAAERRHERNGHDPPLAQLPHVELAPGLEPYDEEEEGHQTLVHPVAQVL
jgi:hypothetical protein